MFECDTKLRVYLAVKNASEYTSTFGQNDMLNIRQLWRSILSDFTAMICKTQQLQTPSSDAWASDKKTSSPPSLELHQLPWSRRKTAAWVIPETFTAVRTREWSERLWDQGNLFQTCVVRVIAPGQEVNGVRAVFFIFCKIMVFCVCSLESRQWGDSNEYTQRTFSW